MVPVVSFLLAMFADPYEYEETTIITQVGDANFKATGKVPTKQGWQALFDDHKADQQEAATLPLVHQGDQVQANLQTPFLFCSWNPLICWFPPWWPAL